MLISGILEDIVWIYKLNVSMWWKKSGEAITTDRWISTKSVEKRSRDWNRGEKTPLAIHINCHTTTIVQSIDLREVRQFCWSVLVCVCVFFFHLSARLSKCWSLLSHLAKEEGGGGRRVMLYVLYSLSPQHTLCPFHSLPTSFCLSIRTRHGIIEQQNMTNISMRVPIDCEYEWAKNEKKNCALTHLKRIAAQY